MQNWRRDRRKGFCHNVSPVVEPSIEDMSSSSDPSSLRAFIARLGESCRGESDGGEKDSEIDKEAAELLALSTARKVNGFLLRPARGHTRRHVPQFDSNGAGQLDGH
ncbi:hypothetical protein QBC37DRAFT_429257 [Rhypophila decipiens]|uniref:Uncharacterized protein n=1 Tax=Rhypophila decipiens TaxID=261697 RepID=A0AAN6Y688_9PEZI|nr:hypothetical protein QBC37DRAFT_429257 [Rhypophila decipiens]